jgi:hypothetical protein
MLRALLVCCAFLVAPALSAPTESRAAPPGRAWTPLVQENLPGWSFLNAPRFLLDENGVPRMHVGAVLNSGVTAVSDAFVLSWADSTWQVRSQLGQEISLLSRVAQPPTTDYLLTYAPRPPPTDPSGAYRYLILADFQTGAIESLSIVHQNSNMRAGVVTPSGFWVLVNDAGTLELYTRHADSPQWKKMYVPANGPGSVAATDRTDSSVVITWTSNVGLCWASATLDTFNLEGTIAPFAGGPSMWTATDGTMWLAWPDLLQSTDIATFDGASWTVSASLDCDLAPTAYYGIDAVISGLGDHAPAIATQAAIGGQLVSCVRLPGVTGYCRGDLFPGGLFETIAVDRNGDAWLAWYLDPTVRWTHTYCTADIEAVAVHGTAAEREVTWTISESAPGAWWAIDRADGDLGFDEVARVTSDAGLDVGWIDTMESSLDSLRYRVRRECVDKRYVLSSQTVTWVGTADAESDSTVGQFSLVGFVPNPSIRGASIAFTLPAPGRAILELLDIAGRRVFRRDVGALGVGRHVVRVDDGSQLAPGVYLIRLKSGARLLRMRGVVVR